MWPHKESQRKVMSCSCLCFFLKKVPGFSPRIENVGRELRVREDSVFLHDHEKNLITHLTTAIYTNSLYVARAEAAFIYKKLDGGTYSVWYLQ